MRNKFVSLQALALLVIFCLTGSLTRAAVNPKPFVVPELKQWTGKDGNFTPGKDTRIVCTCLLYTSYPTPISHNI